MNDEAQHTTSRDAPLQQHPPEQRPLWLSAVYAIGGHGVYHACQLGALILLAKFASPEIQGQYFLALAIATPVVLLLGFELRGAFVADAGNQFTFGTYRKLRQMLTLLASLALGGALAWQAASEPQPHFMLILAGVFATKLVWTLADVGWGTYQRRERLGLFAATVILRGLTLIGPFAVLLPLYARWVSSGSVPADRLAEGTALAIVLHAVGSLLVLWLFDRPRVLDPRLWNLSWTWPAVRKLAWQTMPLGLVALTINLCDAWPRFLIEAQADGKAQLGYFGALAYITLAGNLVMIQAGTAAANRLSTFYQRDLRKFLRLGGLLAGAALLVGATVMLIAIYMGDWILTTVYTPEYAQFEAPFRIIVLAHGLALLTNVFGIATTQMRLFWVQVPVQVVTLAATISAAFILIPGDDPIGGAAWTALVRAAVQLVLYGACVAYGLARRERIMQFH